MKKSGNPLLVIRYGLACVFLAQSLSAFFTNEIQGLAAHSLLGQLPLSVASIAMIISLNDLLVATLLVLGWRTSWVARYAALWTIGAILTIGTSSFSSLEHVGFLAMAVALF